MNFLEELRWRGMLHDLMPGVEEKLQTGMVSGYIGFDPTADSLHVGSLAQIMTLIHFQQAGHKPFVLVGGATGMVGDPSGKSAERNLLSAEVLQHNLNGIQQQLEKFLDFKSGENRAEIVNNYDWFKNFSFLDFIRDAGKHITVNYMMAKDSVKKRLEGETGMSFTEFSYQLIQGYDFYYLWKNRNCQLQMGGSDQWGNMVTGTELIRRKDQGEAFALTTQLIKKADGSKFGKSESGNIWLDPAKTSPYQFYQFWLNAGDEDAKKYIRTFTLQKQHEIEILEQEHDAAPHLRILQKSLSKDITVRVHGEENFGLIEITNEFTFNNNFKWKDLFDLEEGQFLKVFKSTKQYFAIDELGSSTTFFAIRESIKEFVKDDLISFLTIVKSFGEEDESYKPMFESKSEARKLILNGGVYINKIKVTLDQKLSDFELYKDKYMFVQKGKKNSALVNFCNDVFSELHRMEELLKQ